jgi:hypothetical protein
MKSQGGPMVSCQASLAQNPLKLVSGWWCLWIRGNLDNVKGWFVGMLKEVGSLVAYYFVQTLWGKVTLWHANFCAHPSSFHPSHHRAFSLERFLNHARWRPPSKDWFTNPSNYGYIFQEQWTNLPICSSVGCWTHWAAGQSPGCLFHWNRFPGSNCQHDRSHLGNSLGISWKSEIGLSSNQKMGLIRFNTLQYVSRRFRTFQDVSRRFKTFQDVSGRFKTFQAPTM